MIRKSIVSLLMLCLVTAVMAVPARRQWMTVKQPDGTTIEVMPVGDEFSHYFITRDKVALLMDDDGGLYYANAVGFAMSSSGILAHEALFRDDKEKAIVTHQNDAEPLAVQARSAKKRSATTKVRKSDNFIGQKKGIIILAAFQNKEFSMPDDELVQFYDRMANEDGFSDNGAPGSVHNYFMDMSRGVFDLTFDVVGPVTLSYDYDYYGENDSQGNDKRPDEMIVEACQKAKEKYDINFSDYDWDKDGEVEEVFVLYAGYGEATATSMRTLIWPHMYWLRKTNRAFKLDGVKIDTYACSNELDGKSGTTKMGHGVFCHEFSHCMGLPDFYDTSYSGFYGMGDWDLLDHGSYNGPGYNGWCPAGYTSYERMVSGWLDFTELQPNDSIRGMKPLTDPEGKAYVIYNDAWKDEYYLLENRKKESWDAYLPDQGMLILHVDYDKEIFDQNTPNTKVTAADVRMYDDYTKTNDHQRMTMFHTVKSAYSGTYYDVYPLKNTIDSLTDSSKPAATLYNANTDGKKYMHKPIFDIKRDSNTGYMSFNFMPKPDPVEQTLELDTINEMTYGDEPYELPAETAEKQKIDWTVEFDSIAVVADGKLTIKGAGKTKVTAKQEGNDLYLPFERVFNVTINKANLLIYVADTIKQVGTENPEFEITYDSFVYGEDESVLTKQPTASTTADINSPEGEYVITVEGAEADNYEIEYREGTLTVVTELPAILGDINGDRKVNTTDITALYNVIFGNDTTTDRDVCDLNGDGEVNTTDVTVLYNIIFGTAK